MLHLIWFNQALPKFSFIWRLIPDMQLSGWNRAQQHRPKPNESAFGPNVIFFFSRSLDQVKDNTHFHWNSESKRINQFWVESIMTARNELCHTLTIMYFVLLNRLVHRKKCESNKELQSKTEWMNRVHWTQIDCRFWVSVQKKEW